MDSYSLKSQSEVSEESCAMSLYSRFVPLYINSLNLIPDNYELTDELLDGIV